MPEKKKRGSATLLNTEAEEEEGSQRPAVSSQEDVELEVNGEANSSIRPALSSEDDKELIAAAARSAVRTRDEAEEDTDGNEETCPVIDEEDLDSEDERFLDELMAGEEYEEENEQRYSDEAEEIDAALRKLLASSPETLADELAPDQKVWARNTDKLAALLRRRHGDFLDLAWDPRKGRVLCCRRRFMYGATILTDRPLLKVTEPEEDDELWTELRRICTERDLGIQPIWYFAALSVACGGDKARTATNAMKMKPPEPMGEMKAPSTPSTTKIGADRDEFYYEPSYDQDEDPEFSPVEVRKNTKKKLSTFLSCLRPPKPAAVERLKLLFRQKVTEPSLGVMHVLYGLDLLDILDPLEVEEGLQTFVQNAFQCATDSGVNSLGVWLTPSFISHSCMPNTSWLEQGDGNFVLVAAGNISPGEELTLSYISMEDLTYSVAYRREVLAKTKHFVCNCFRCANNDAYKPYNCPICGINLLYARSEEELQKFSFCRRALTQVSVNTYVLGHLMVCATSAQNW